MNTKELLLDLSSRYGVGGHADATDYAVKLLSKYGSVTLSPLGSIICTVKEAIEGSPHILLDAHIDEIGFLVSYIEDNGFLRVANFGGTDPRVYASERVLVHAKSGDINGVICSVPPHLRVDDNKLLPADKIYIDTGLSTEDASEIISPGDRISFVSKPKAMLNDYISNKALDDRVGCGTLIKALDEFNGDYPCGLTVMFSTMEEIGGAGAQTGAYSIAPTAALVVDATFGEDPNIPSYKTVKLGSGPSIGFSPLLSSTYSNTLVALAKANDIPYTCEVMAGSTGTNADGIVASRGGVATAIVSVPIRNMHMPIEMLDIRDVENSAKLIALWIREAAKEGLK